MRNMSLMFSEAETAEIEKMVQGGGETRFSDFVDLLVRNDNVSNTKL